MRDTFKGVFDCIKAFSETNATEDLKRLGVSILIMHCDDNQIVLIGAYGLLSADLDKNAQLKIYRGTSHGICSMQKDEGKADLLAFFKAQAIKRRAGDKP